MSRNHVRNPFGVAILGLLALLLLLQSGASAQTQIKDPLQPCKQVQAYQDAKKARYEAAGNRQDLTFTKDKLDAKYARYDAALCGVDGLPHLVVSGQLDRAGDFLIPGVLFLWIAGALGWAGRAYLAESKGPEDEILIDLPKAIKCLLLGLAWPAFAIPELVSGKIRVPQERVTISPR